MKFMKPVLATLVAAGLVSPVYAAYHGSGHAAHQAVKHSASAHAKAKIYSNSPMSHADAASWKNRFALGATATYGVVNYKLNSHGAVNKTASNLVNANLFVDAMVAEDVDAHMNLYYNGVTQLMSGVESVSDGVSAPASFSIDEAYVTVRGVGGSDSPLYVRAGKEYVPFGRVTDVYSFMPSLTQVFTLHNEHALQLGYADNSGISGAVYIFKDAASASHPEDANKLNKFGLNVAYANHYADYDYDLSAGYINDYRSTTVLSPGRTLITEDMKPAAMDVKASAWTVHAGVKTGPFKLSADYSAVSKDLDLDVADTKPVVWGVDAAYYADMAGMKGAFDVAYERVNDNGQNASPYKSRWGVGFDTEVFKNTHAKLEYANYRTFGNENDTGLMASLRVDA